MTTLTRLMDNLRIRLPGALDKVIYLELFSTIDEFCRVTFAWEQVVAIALVEDEFSYPVAPEGTVAVEVLEVRHATYDVTQTIYSNGSLTVPYVPKPEDYDTPLFVTVILAPKADNEVPEDWLPEDIMEKNLQTLIDGVCMRMMTQAAKAYSNPTLAQYHGRRWRNALGIAKNEVKTGDVAGGIPWRFPRFA